MPKPWKRLELRLPANHPVWNLPEGSRSKIVREWLEVGRKLAEIEQTVKGINEKLDSGICMNEKLGEPERQTDTPEAGFDKNTFLSHFK